MNSELIYFLLGLLVSVIFGYYFYIKSLRIKEPIYSIWSTNVISDYSSKYKNLTVSYKNEKVENFTVSRVVFFNRGAMTIDRNDIATLNQLRIIAKSGNILDATVMQVNNPSSDFKVSLDRANGWIIVDFDYLNQDHGAVIEVIHTGLVSEDIELVGDIKEVKSLKRLLPLPVGSVDSVPHSGAVRLMSILGAFAMIVFLGYSGSGMLEQGFNATAVGDRLILFSFSIISVGMATWLIWYMITRDYLNLRLALPKGLERFFEKN